MSSFRQVLEENDLFDLGWRGEKYTWSNKHEDDMFTKERLDRAVANVAWISIFIQAIVDVLATRCSDHKPLLMRVDRSIHKNIFRRKMFRYEANWARDEKC